MATINTFKEIRSWQMSKDLAVTCYKLTQESAFKFEFALVNQLRKSAISVPSNIAEGFERKGNKEFIQFLFIAVGSLSELECQLIIANEIGFLDTSRLQKLEADILSIRKAVYGMIAYLKNSELKGYKFAEPAAPYGKYSTNNDLTADEIPIELQEEAAEVWSKYEANIKDEFQLELLELPTEFINNSVQG
jgi:four helix bundle protein